MENYLAHYGILGMRWGVRRSKAQLERARGKTKSDDDSSEESSTKKKSVSEMSDDELRTRLNRMNMEIQYRNAVNQLTPKKESRVKRVLKDVAESAFKSVSSKAVERATNSLFKAPTEDKKTNWKDIDLDSVGDKALQAALKRATSERAIQRMLDEDAERSKK